MAHLLTVVTGAVYVQVLLLTAAALQMSALLVIFAVQVLAPAEPGVMTSQKGRSGKTQRKNCLHSVF
jgi:hypothetical protein